MTDSGLSIVDLHTLRDHLHKRRYALEVELESVLGRSEEECSLALNEDVFGTKEDAMLAEISGTYRADINRLRNNLADIDAALARCAAGTYGICMHCGQQIAYDRLLSQPSTVRCQICHAAFERLPNASPTRTLPAT